MKIPERFHIFKTKHWLINHRIDSALPGYLMVGSKMQTTDLSDLPESALSELGPLFALSQKSLKDVLSARYVYIGRYGHTPGYPIHFHIIPIYDWVEDLFWKDERYRLLDSFAEDSGDIGADGSKLTFYVWREFCGRPAPPPIIGPSVSQTIELLRAAIRLSD